jgi:hypothetical protein
MTKFDVRPLLAVCSLLGLGGCIHQDDVMKPCPTPGILEDAETVTSFDGKGQQPANVVSRVTISNIQLKCQYKSLHKMPNKQVKAAIEFDMAVELGPAASQGPVTVPYFVAVTRNTQAILAREQYSRTFDVRAGGAATVREKVDDVEIPLASKATGANYEVIVGLVESEDQLARNRARHTQN